MVSRSAKFSQKMEQAIAALRRELSPQGNVVSAQGRARTIAAFGEPLAPREVVERICADVAARGLDAVLDYSLRLDGVTLEAGQKAEIKVPVLPEEEE